jgi:hypothetical protein
MQTIDEFEFDEGKMKEMEKIKLDRNMEKAVINSFKELHSKKSEEFKIKLITTK